MKASYHSCTKYRTFASILFQLSELDLRSFRKLLFPLILFSKPKSNFWKLSLLAAWWKFLLVFLIKNSKIWVDLDVLRLPRVSSHFFTFRRHPKGLWSRAGIRSNCYLGFRPTQSRWSAPAKVCSSACSDTGLNFLSACDIYKKLIQTILKTGILPLDRQLMLKKVSYLCYCKANKVILQS